MKTVYIDVYFLINFCVDVLALSAASYLTKMKCRVMPLIAAGIIGALYAVAALFVSENKIVMLPLSILIFLAMLAVVTRGASIRRKLRYTIAFFAAQIIIGGLVYYGYCLLDRLFEGITETEAYGENRRLLIWSIIVLLSFGVLKILTHTFSALRSIRSATLYVSFLGREESTEALVDSGNLAVDPRNGSAVVFINEKFAKKVLGASFEFFDKMNVQTSEVAKKLRIIPIERGDGKKILYGFVADKVEVEIKNRRESINVTLAIDKKGESYGGFSALLPLSAIENVF